MTIVTFSRDNCVTLGAPTRILFWGVGALVLVQLAACDGAPLVDRVGVNVVDKSVFDGSWYMARTVIDVAYEGGAAGTFVGDVASDFAESSFSATPRIRWVIEEDYLYAFRDYEFIQGVDGVPRVPGEHLGQPVAAYPIESHFDIRRAFNPITGEEQNVLEENDQDRRWFERAYMRVDWSKNQLAGYFGQTKDLFDILGVWVREPTDLFVQGNSAFPDAWQPQFHRMSCAGLDDPRDSCLAADRDFAEEYAQGDMYTFGFVEQETLYPGEVVDPISGAQVNWCLSAFADAPTCSAVNVFTRTSFLKVSDQRQYQPTNWNDKRFDRHGFFRLEQPTEDRRTDASDSSFGRTDFLNYNINRYNLWREWTDAAGAPLPFEARRVRPIVWTTTPELPAHLVKPSIEVVSAWNSTLMATVRGLRKQPAAAYPRVPCQSEDPDGYCFCQASPDGGAVLNPTCAGRYDPFESPAQAAARGVQNPYRCHVEVPAGAEPDLSNPAIETTLTDGDYLGWFGATFVGDECVTTLEMNTCNGASLTAAGILWTSAQTVDAARDAGLECEERGDLRYRFLSYVDQPGTPFLGIATIRSDPVSGEIVMGDANIGGPALDRYRTTALEQLSLLNGDLTEQEFYSGEDVRAYLESIDQVAHPAPPRIDFLPQPASRAPAAAGESMGDVARRRMDRALGKAAGLSGPLARTQILSDRLDQLAGSATESRLTRSPEFFAQARLASFPGGGSQHPTTDAVLDQASPFRTTAQDKLRAQDALADRLARANMMMPNEYIDNSVTAYIENHQDYSRARLELEVNRLLYFETQLHEVGHCLGLRHQFAGSADADHYHDDYYLIDQRFPYPDPGDFDVDSDPGLSADEQLAYEDAYNSARENRELAGIDRWKGSSVMDYTAQWYERTSNDTGYYDKAAIAFGYGDLVELYDTEGVDTGGRTTPQNTPRVPAFYYEGGEVCSTDSDCPFSADGAQAASLTEGNRGAGLTQRCVPNPRDPGLGTLCSNFDDDAAALDASGRFQPISYRFCTDQRAGGGSNTLGTIGLCNRYDEGESYREIVRNVVDSYERMYLWTNFRRYRSSFDLNPYVFNSLIGNRLSILQNVYQNLMFRYANDIAFREQEGAFGFEDQYFATADILNFYGRILGTPDVGGYRFSEQTGRYEQISNDPEDLFAQMSLPIGPARYSDTVYQAGLSGIYRIERIGTFYDKLFVLDLMTRRGTQPLYTVDVPFYTNFYDLFPLEVGQIFGGMIRDRPEAFMPRVTCGGGAFPVCDEPRIVYPDFFRGDCSEGSASCRDTVETLYAGDPVVDGGSSLFLQIYAALYALAEFPVFFDTTFARQLYICREGAGDCPTPRPSAVEGADFVRHESGRFGQTYVAFRVDGQDASDPTGEASSLGFQMVKEAADLAFIQDMLVKYEGGGIDPPLDPDNLTSAERTRLSGLGYDLPPDAASLTQEQDRVGDRIVDLEGFFNQLIQLERDLGVASYLGYAG